MSKQPGGWGYSHKPQRPKVSDAIKAEVSAQASALIETALKPKYTQPTPEDQRFNYIEDLYTKWRGSYLYFCAQYRSPGPDAITPTFEARFARLEYLSRGRFNLSFMRYTGQWIELYQGLPLEECLTAISDDPFFQP